MQYEKMGSYNNKVIRDKTCEVMTDEVLIVLNV